MAIDRIPGVGPQNSDIATAVSTAVPTLAQITTAITTNAASAGVTMAAITSAITTNAASAGVTMAAITSAIQANAGSPVGGTWTNLGTVDLNGLQGTTISSLSGYKYIRFYMGIGASVATRTQLRFNSDTGSNYWGGVGNTNSIAASPGYGIQNADSSITLNGNPSGNNRVGIIVEIENSNSTIYKMVRTQGVIQYATSAAEAQFSIGTWNNTAAISSITLLNHYPGTYDAGSRLFIVGGN
jgi:hypothetical protein